MASQYPCSQSGTIQVLYNAPGITPADGYKVKWRVFGSTTWNDYPNQSTNPINIVGVPTCYNLEVSIQASCGGGNFGPEVIVPVTGNSVTCFGYILNNDGIYQYTPCGSVDPVNIQITSTQPVEQRTVCAKENTVIVLSGNTSGAFTKDAQCVV